MCIRDRLVRIVRERLGQPAAAPEEEAPRVATFKGVDVAALMQYIDFNYSRIISLEDLSTDVYKRQSMSLL